MTSSFGVYLTSSVKENEVIDGRYQVRRIVGSGALGTVYLAFDQQLSREVAIKIINVPAGFNINDEPAKRLIREAQALSLLKHPGVIEIYRIGFLNDVRPFLVMEYVDSQSLSEYLHHNGPFDYGSAIDLIIQIADALQHTHMQGVVHRDIKPHNLLIETTANGAKARLADFGLSSLTEQMSQDQSRLTLTGSVIGTPQYMSPEQCRGEKLDERSDIYSLGLVLFEMLTGQPAFPASDPAQAIFMQLNDPLPDLAQAERSGKFPNLLQEILSKATQKKREARYQTVQEMLVELRAAAAKNFSGRFDPSRLVRKSAARKSTNVIKYSFYAIAAVLILTAGLCAALLSTEFGRRSVVKLIVSSTSPQDAIGIIGALESIQLSLEGPAAASKFGQAVLDCDTIKLWNSPDLFDLSYTVFKNAGPNPPLDVGFPAALCAFGQADRLVTVRTTGISPFAGFDPMKGNNVTSALRLGTGFAPEDAAEIEKAGAVYQERKNRYLPSGQVIYLAPLEVLSDYLRASRLSIDQYRALYRVLARQGLWSGRLSEIDNAIAGRLFVKQELLGVMTYEKLFPSGNTSYSEYMASGYLACARFVACSNDPKFKSYCTNVMRFQKMIPKAWMADLLLTKAKHARFLGSNQEAFDYYAASRSLVADKKVSDKELKDQYDAMTKPDRN